MKFVLFVTILFEVAIHFTSADCAPSEWKCVNGQCISSINATCDSFPDCNDGSDENNCPDTITCSEDRKKCFHSNGKNFTCTNSDTPCDCGSPENIMYGTATLDDPTNSSEGASASVTCDNGYQTSKPSLTCLSTGLWTTSSCTAKDCGQLPSIPAGSITLVDPKNTTYGASATVTCFTGFQANVTSISCFASGLWESASCTVTDCGQLPPMSAGSITLVDPNNTTYGASATVTCFTGYQANVTSVTCLASGLWESASCTVIVCGSVPNISFGTIHLTDRNNVSYGAEALVECDDEYVAIKLVIKCLASGQWDIASCEKASPAATLTPKDNNTAMIIIIIVASIIGGPCLIQLTVAIGLHITIYRISNRGGKACGYILLSAIPFIGIRYMRRYYKWGGYMKYQVERVNEEKKRPPNPALEFIPLER